MNNNTNGVNGNQGPYYQPPNYYQQYGCSGSPAPGSYSPKKQGYALAAEKALSTMNLPLLLIFSIIFGWICSRTVWVGRIGIGMTVMGVLFYAFFMPFIMHKQQRKVPLSAWLLFIPQIAVFVSFALYSSPRNKTCGLLISLAIAIVQTTLIAGCTEGRPFSKELLSDACCSYLAYPFMNMGQTLKAVFGLGKDKSVNKKGKVASKILIGLLISIPVVFVLMLMFSGADTMFHMCIERAIDLLDISPWRILSDVILTAVTMLYVMPLVVTLRSGYHSKYVERAVNRPLDPIITTTVLFAASVIYLSFIAVQFAYLFANVSGLPKGFYAEYCRRGFFELVFITVATTAVIALVCMFTTHNDKGRLPAYTKAALLLISACDCVMVASSAYRLVIYVREYSMTVARFNAAVVIAFMAVCVIVMSLKIMFEKFKISVVVGGALIVAMAFYSVFNVDGFIARYNIDRYLNGTTDELDMSYIKYNLSSAVIPELNRLGELSSDEAVKEDAENAIMDVASIHSVLCDDYSLTGWTWDRYRAAEIAKKVLMPGFSYSKRGGVDDSDVTVSASDLDMS